MNQDARVQIVDFKETHVAAMEHRGDPAPIADTVAKFIEWRRQAGLPPKTSATFNILYNSPVDTAPEDCRLDLCAATDREIAPDEAGIVSKIIPGGRCAVLRHIGSEDGLGEAVSYLCRHWFPQSGEKRRDFPVFFQRVSFFPEVPEYETVIDIFLPLE